MDGEALSENQHDECFTSTENLQTNKFTGERGKSGGANDMFEPQRVVVEMERECTNITETSRKLNLLLLFSTFLILSPSSMEIRDPSCEPERVRFMPAPGATIISRCICEPK